MELTIQQVLRIVSDAKKVCSVRIRVYDTGHCELWTRNPLECIMTFHGYWENKDAEQSYHKRERTSIED